MLRKAVGQEFESPLAHRAFSLQKKNPGEKEIEAKGWSLNPGNYIGIAPGEAVTDEDFREQLEALSEELEILNTQATQLKQIISANVAQVLGV